MLFLAQTRLHRVPSHSLTEPIWPQPDLQQDVRCCSVFIHQYNVLKWHTSICYPWWGVGYYTKHGVEVWVLSLVSSSAGCHSKMFISVKRVLHLDGLLVVSKEWIRCRIYYANVKLGSPPKEYSLQFDTGSDLMWVPCSSCTSCRETNNNGVRRSFSEL